MTQKSFLNLGCGRVILPAAAPAHYSLLPAGLTDYALWHNVDRNAQPGVDETLDIFRYPWPWANNSFDGALLSHIAEHVPHEIRLDRGEMRYFNSVPRSDGGTYLRPTTVSDAAFSITLEPDKLKRAEELSNLQDGWFAFFAELYRVLTPGALIHVLSPHGWSQGGITDPTHTRLLTADTFTHSMQPDPNAPFQYATGGLNLALDDVRYAVTPEFAHLLGQPEQLQASLTTRLNVASELYVRLKVVK